MRLFRPLGQITVVRFSTLVDTKRGRRKSRQINHSLVFSILMAEHGANWHDYFVPLASTDGAVLPPGYATTSTDSSRTVPGVEGVEGVEANLNYSFGLGDSARRG